MKFLLVHREPWPFNIWAEIVEAQSIISLHCFTIELICCQLHVADNMQHILLTYHIHCCTNIWLQKLLILVDNISSKYQNWYWTELNDLSLKWNVLAKLILYVILNIDPLYVITSKKSYSIPKKCILFEPNCSTITTQLVLRSITAYCVTVSIPHIISFPFPGNPVLHSHCTHCLVTSS